MDKSDLLGTWSLVRAFETRDDRVVDAAPLGPKPSGFIHYLDDGRMAVVIAHDGRRPLSGSRRETPDSELAAAARTLDAYAGPYEILDDETVVHHIEVSSFQNDLGQEYVRTVRIVDGELHLGTPRFPTPEGLRGMYLVWRRLDRP